ncbi:hypothetical protein BpHYR1_048901 [Brachionus plicatilis]|uniref:Uncharacterized protein n=1 Tax=Brachionus plicatilis TaxID=10195 RepID=A0A3M7STV1_BRAPC|nr:hypothetical protein BpHYR1_048901 [Brachionus plicatilis]
MAKSQKKIESFYQEDAIKYQLSRDLNFPNEGQFDKYIDLAYGSIFQQTSLYQFQQKTIEIQKKEIEQLRIENRNLLAQHNEHGLELEKITQMLNLKTIEVDELRQTLLMEVVHMKGELIKSHYRIQTSLMKVNKRLEEEVLKLKSNLSEKAEINSKLLEKIDQMQSSMDELKMLKFSSFFETEGEWD